MEERARRLRLVPDEYDQVLRLDRIRQDHPAIVVGAAGDTGCDSTHRAADGKLTETTALIHDLAVQRESFRAEIGQRARLIAPGKNHGKAVRAMNTPGQEAILQPPKPEITPSATILQLAAEHDIEPEAGG